MIAALSGKTAVVTGVTSGIGAALVDRLISAGATVAGVGRDRAKLEAMAARLGPTFLPFVIELGSPEARQNGFAQIAASCERVDILVNNAAACVYELPLSLPPARWRELLEVNFLAGVELLQALAPRLGASGHVVNLSSVTARFLPSSRFAPYAVTKAALEQFTEALRLDLDPRGIKVTLVVPGLVDTPIYDKVEGFEKTRRKIREQIPTWLSPDDVAEAIVWIVTQPAHVVVAELVLLPRGQAR